jgi:isopenicillin N synthase-like dioxygenase
MIDPPLLLLLRPRRRPYESYRTDHIPSLSLSSGQPLPRITRSLSMTTADHVPVIDLSSSDEDFLVQQIAAACENPGFFQVTHHGVPLPLVQDFRRQCRDYFDQPASEKLAQKRHSGNARGYFDDELTQQRRDWKECCDVGQPGSKDWNTLPDDSPENACLDGFNQFPTGLPAFRATVVAYFKACQALSHRLAVLMAQGLGVAAKNDDFLRDLQENHTSYLRMNYYPTCCTDTGDSEEEAQQGGALGISPHKDAGFLTVLLQDDDCHSLQVLDASQSQEQCWTTVHPIPGALTINTGDMAQAWSNGRYKAPLHRVLTNSSRTRYSVPFFYNPGYDCLVTPLRGDGVDVAKPRYHPVLWGYFRAVRFAGDLTDLGVEIQVDDFLLDRAEKSHHLAKQELFAKANLAARPFNVDTYRELLLE